MIFCGSLFNPGHRGGQFNQKKNYNFVINDVVSYKEVAIRLPDTQNLTPETEISNFEQNTGKRLHSNHTGCVTPVVDKTGTVLVNRQESTSVAVLRN